MTELGNSGNHAPVRERNPSGYSWTDTRPVWAATSSR